jgi:hypothetical protein
LAWPKNIEPTYQGYSIGRWIDEDSDGRFDALEVETKGPFKGPRIFDLIGLPLHYDNQSTFEKRIYLDNTNPNILHDKITDMDNALTRPLDFRQKTSAIQICGQIGPKSFAPKTTPRFSSARRTIFRVRMGC